MRVAVVWAFLGFSNLALLQVGIAAVSIPIIIHLLNRKKYREVPWAAMKFLLAAIRKNRRRVQIEQWLLLAVRTLLILFVVSAMAKPFLESAGVMPLLPGQRTHRVIVIDASMSMSYTVADASRFDQAKSLAAQLVKDARRGDALSVVLMAEPPRIVIGEASPSSNQDEVIKEINQITQTHGTADLTATFEAVDRVLEVSTISRKEVLFVTDMQASTWRKAGGADEGLRRQIAKLEKRQAKSIVIDLGKDGGENRAVVDVKINAPVVTLGSSDLVVTAVLRNLGRTVAKSTRARLLIDGKLGPEQTADLPPATDVPFAFTPSFSSAGDHLLEVRIDGDPLAADDARRLAVPVRDALKVLLVDGAPKTEPFQSETDYLLQALQPSTGSPGESSPIRADVVTETQLARRELSAYDVVVVCNVAQFTQAEVGALETFLKQGGGVVVFSGDLVIPENYNRVLFADGKGLLPAAIGDGVGDAQAKSAAFDFNPLGFKHPIVASYAGADAPVIAGLTNVKTWRYHKLKVPEGSDAKIVMTYVGGTDPVIVEAPRHRGRVIQVATSADAGWSTWPLHKAYVPLMEQIVLQAAAGKLAERTVRVGRPLEQTMPKATERIPVEVARPDGVSLPTSLSPIDDGARLHYEDTDVSGAYRVKYGPPISQESLFAANPDPLESDLAKLDRVSLGDALPGWKFDYLTNWRELSGNASSVSRRGELHRPLLYGVLLLLVVESILAWKFGHHA